MAKSVLNWLQKHATTSSENKNKKSIIFIYCNYFLGRFDFDFYLFKEGKVLKDEFALCLLEGKPTYEEIHYKRVVLEFTLKCHSWVVGLQKNWSCCTCSLSIATSKMSLYCQRFRSMEGISRSSIHQSLSTSTSDDAMARLNFNL